MHLKSQGNFNCDENDEVERDAPSGTDSDDEAMRNGVHDEFDNVDSETSENDDELPYNVDEFLNPVYDIEALNIVDPDDIIDNDTNTGAEDEEPFEGIFNEFNFVDQEGSSSSSEMSDDYEANEWEIVERNNQQPDASNNPEGANLNSTQPGTSHNSNNEDLNNAHQGVLINQDISTSNHIERENLNSSEQSKSQNSDNEDLNNAQQGASNNKEISTTNDIEKVNLNSTQQGASQNSDNEDLNNAQQGACASNNLETNTTNARNPNLFNDDRAEFIFITCDDECIEPIAISTPSFGTSYSPNMYYGRQNSGFETPESSASINLNNRGPRNSEYPFPYPPNNGARGNAGNMQPSSAPATQSSENTSAPPVSNTTSSSQHHSAGNPGYATLHLLPRDTLLNHPGCPTSHYHLSPGRCYPGPYSTIVTAPNNRTYRELHSANYYGPDYPGYTGPRSANYRAQNNHGHVAPPPCNEPTYNPPRNNASYRAPQASRYDASGNLASGTTQSTSYIAADASSGGTADASAYEVPNASAYEVPNASGYGTSTSFEQSDQLSPGQGTSVPPAYLGPHAYNYGNPYSPNYIAPDSSSGATHYSQFSAPSSGYPDTLDVSENVVSQSPVTQVLSNDKASGSTVPYNYGGPSTSGYSTSARNELTSNNASYETPQASGYDASDDLAFGTTQSTNYIAPSASADETADASAYEALNASGYGASTSFDQSDQLSPRQGTSVQPAYLSPHVYDYGNEYSPNYIALDPSSDATHYSQYSAPSSGCPDTLDVSENVTSHSPVTQVLSNDEASSSTASYNYGGPSISGYGTPARNEPTINNASYRTPQAHDASDNLDPVTTGHGRPGWFFFTVNDGLDSISYNSPNSTGYDASGMSGDAELGLSGGQRGRRHPFNSRSQSRSLPNSTRRHGRGRGDKHGQ